MAKGSDNSTAIGLLLMRLIAGGLLFYGHGLPKLMNWRERMSTFSDPIGLGPAPGFWLVVFAEVVCSVLVMLGWFTRAACVLPIGFFLIAALIHHAEDPFRQKELALIYMAPFLCLLFTGPGRFSLDARFGPKVTFKGS